MPLDMHCFLYNGMDIYFWSTSQHTCCGAVYINWTGLVDWTGGLTLKIIFMLSDDTHSPVELCGSPAALFLATYMVPEQITH